ncbi:MAG: hypothetical protein QXP42_05880 [Candidatus Micrarchaeia archaeon]
MAIKLPSEEDEKKAKVEKEIIREPKVEGFVISAQRISSETDILSVFLTMSFEVTKKDEEIVVISVESRDINKRPYIFTIFKMKQDSVEFLYSVVPEVSPQKRRLDAMKEFINVLSLLEGRYRFDHKQVYQIFHTFIDGITEYVSLPYDQLYAKYDALVSELLRAKTRIEELTKSNEELAQANMELKKINDELTVKISELEAYSDEVLMLKIQEWLFEHGNEINVEQFAKVFGVNETRVEQILNKMVKEGYLEVKV